MSKAKTIDRIELTRKKFGLKKNREHHEQELAPADEHGLSEYPHCGAQALRRDGGCMSCLACGWSACG